MVTFSREADVVVVGSGATGSLIAARLGRAGLKVVVLEGGPQRSLERLYSSTIWSRRLKWGGPPVRSAGNNAVPVHFESGWGLGGAGLHHYACWFRLHPEDFQKKSLFGRGADWPISYDDLRPYYDALQAEIGISGDAEREVWRPPGAPYPMPAQPTFRQAEIIASGFEKTGLRVAPLPMAINSVAYNGRPACLQDGWCDAGCPTGALANPIVLFAQAMREAGVEVICNASVSRVLTDGAERRATGVRYFDSKGEERRIAAKLVVLAANAIQNPRILLNSAGARHAAGLANSSGLVGRGFFAHGAVSLYGMFDEPTENFMGRSGGQLMSQESYARDPKRGYRSGFTWRIGQALKLADLGGIGNARGDLFGEALSEFMEAASQHLGTMSALVDNLPDPASRVALIAEKDRYGLPLVAVTHSLAAEAKKALSAAIEQGGAIMRAAGAHDTWAAPVRTEHMMGGTPMGRDPRHSVTNGYGQTHDVENLFVAGPGLFPTGGAVNPTFTASALAARSADHIIREWTGLAQGSRMNRGASPVPADGK
jgi:choline dehydrogenase-like flavoprotein